MMRRVIINSNWWHRRTAAKKCLTLVSIFACITVNSLVSGGVLNSNPKGKELECPKELSNVCLTPECVHTAKSVLENLKSKIKPCDNFYEFACGTYLDKTRIPEDIHEVNRIHNIYNKIPKQLKDIITEERPQREPKYLKLPNTLYKACMNTSLIETLDFRPMHRVATLLGGWPVIVGEFWNNDVWVWSIEDTVRRCRELGIGTNFIIEVSTGKDMRHDGKYMIHVGRPSLGLDRNHYSVPFLVSAYQRYMVDVAVLFGADRQTAEADLKKSLEFEQKLAEIAAPTFTFSSTDDLKNLRSIKQVQKDYDYIDWLDYINAHLPQGLAVNENEIINIKDLHYFDELGKLLQETHERTIANYMMWRVYESMLPYLSKKFRNVKMRYDSGKSVRNEEWIRSMECIDIVTGGLGIAMSSLYVLKYFNIDRYIASYMVNSIRDSLVQMLDKSKWISGLAKNSAKKRVQLNEGVIGFPNELFNTTKLEEYYQKLNIDSNAFFESVLSKNIMDTDNSFKKLRSLEPLDEWMTYTHPFDEKHFFLPNDDKIQFSAAIWQDVLFNRHRPMYMNYGAIGSRIGQKFALDLVKETGNTGCIARHFKSYIGKLTAFNTNSNKTIEDITADNIGIRQSYLAYKQYVKKNGEELKLPGLNYTPQQLFWISTAQTLCTKIKKDYALERSVYQTPPEVKIVGSLSNIKEFSSDFMCPKNSLMNPDLKCEVQ